MHISNPVLCTPVTEAVIRGGKHCTLDQVSVVPSVGAHD